MRPTIGTCLWLTHLQYAEKKWHVIVAARREAKLVAVVKVRSSALFHLATLFCDMYSTLFCPDQPSAHIP